MIKHLIIAISVLSVLTCCKNIPKTELSAKWVLNSIDKGATKSNVSFEISGLPKNNSWAIYFSHILGVVDFSSIPEDLIMERIAGDFFKLYPKEGFKLKNEKLFVPYVLDIIIQRQSDAPGGIYYTIGDGLPVSISNYEVVGINKTILSELPLPTAESRYEANQSLTLLPKSELIPIIPRPNSFSYTGGVYDLNDGLNLKLNSSLAVDLVPITKQFKENQDLAVSLVEDNHNLEISYSKQRKSESYKIEVSTEGIEIEVADAEGAFYALQTLASIIDVSDNGNKTIKHCIIEDAPRFPYRGVHLDVARNFHSKETVLKLLDLMSQYKLNKFHFHITDDEGWRLEIPGLPELTEVGSKRGHTTDERNNLVPHYGSGPEVKGSTGTGFYTRADFIEILQFAKSRHIEVIPEIDIPSHARAAIKSMAARYQKYMDQNNEEEALKYLLHDFDDASEYSSAQNFSDNIVCVCQESTYDFVAKVIDEVVNIYAEADVTLNTIHSGGDELPYGPWQKSPVCKKFIAENSDVSHTDELHAYFMKRFKVIMDKKGLNTAGWEEIVLKHSEDAHHGIVLNEDMLGQSYLPYVWNAVWGWGREDMAYKLANAGYEIVFCNSASLYMDMAYNKDPDETGLSWSGWTTTKSAFDVIPLDIFANAKYDKDGNLLAQDDIDNKVKLTIEGSKNFKGIQGQIWCETITSPEKLEYMVFPKMLAIAERAWAAEPAWSDGNDKLQQLDWNNFTNILGQIELKKLDQKFGGIKYRLPLPGAKIVNNQLLANVQFPGLMIRYNTDGSEPNENSTLYEEPINIGSQSIKLKTFSTNGRASRIVTMN